MYSGWVLDKNSLVKLEKLFVQVHPDFIGHHVTYMFGKESVAPEAADLTIVGQCTTDKLQCFVVAVNGVSARPDGSVYHLTWSIDRSKGAKPVDCNAAIKEHGFDHILNPIAIVTTPAVMKF